MDLKKRLTTLRSQRGQPPTQPPPPTATNNHIPDERPPVEERLQRLRPSALTHSAQNNHKESIAELLQGEYVSDGLIVVDRRFPLDSRHGKRTLGPGTQVRPPGTDKTFHVEQCVFMDTETTGLSGGTGTLAFLLGLAYIEAETLHIRQLFLTGFGGEAALLQAATEWMGNRTHLVTFNGKSFDAPLMATRYRLARQSNPFTDMDHIDLFHPTRRAFSTCWPDCRLQTAEKRLLGFFRVDDLPSWEVPDVWFAFMRQGRTDRVDDILAHNRWDILSLVTLLPSLAETYIDPAPNGADVVAIARYYRQRGEEETALTHLQAQQQHLSEQGLLELARIYRKHQDWQPAVSIWEHLAKRKSLEALERLAKYYEHVRRDYQAALDCTHRLKSLDRRQPAHAQREQRLLAKLSR